MQNSYDKKLQKGIVATVIELIVAVALLIYIYKNYGTPWYFWVILGLEIYSVAYTVVVAYILKRLAKKRK